MDVTIKKDLEIMTEENIEEGSISMEEIDIKADFDYKDDEFESDNQLGFQNNQLSNLNSIQPIIVKNEFNLEVSKGYQKLEDDPNIYNPSFSYQEELVQKLCNRDITTMTKKHNTKKNNNKKQMIKVYICEFCNKIIKDHSNYRSHKRIHTGERPYKCSYCSKSFKQSAHLKSHIVTHTGNKQHRCNICQKCFTQSSHLKKHMQSHADTKAFACSKCETKYSDETDLNLHSETHNKVKTVKSYRCPECIETFCHESSFKAHLITHSGLKHFECDICAKSFYEKKSIDAHLRSHMIPRLYACNLCDKKFEQLCGRRVHIKKTHEKSTFHKSNKCFKTLQKEYRFNAHKENWHCKMEDETEDSEILGF